MNLSESLQNRKQPLLWKRIFDLGLQKILATKFRSLRTEDKHALLVFEIDSTSKNIGIGYFICQIGQNGEI